MTDKTNLDELIAAERAKANTKIAKLKRNAVAEQRKVDAKVVALLKEQKSDLYARLASEARDALAAEKAERSAKAKRGAEGPATKPASAGADTDERSEEVRQPWNG